MTRKERRFIYEGIAILFADSLMALFVVPTLVNTRDSMSVFAGGFLAFGAVAWTAYYAYRVNQGKIS